MVKMKQLWRNLLEGPLAEDRNMYRYDPLSIPLLVAECEKHGWDVYDPYEKKGFTAPTLKRLVERMKKMACPMCGLIHIMEVVLVRGDCIERYETYAFIRAVEEGRLVD